MMRHTALTRFCHVNAFGAWIRVRNKSPSSPNKSPVPSPGGSKATPTPAAGTPSSCEQEPPLRSTPLSIPPQTEGSLREDDVMRCDVRAGAAWRAVRDVVCRGTQRYTAVHRGTQRYTGCSSAACAAPRCDRPAARATPYTPRRWLASAVGATPHTSGKGLTRMHVLSLAGS